MERLFDPIDGAKSAIREGIGGVGQRCRERQNGWPHHPRALLGTGIRVLQQADRLSDSKAPLQPHLIAVGGERSCPAQSPLYPVAEVGAQHLGPVEMALCQLVDRHFGGDGASHQIVEVGIAGQRLLHQRALDFPAVVAALCGDQLDGAPLDGIGKARLDEVVAAARLRAGKRATETGLLPAGWRCASQWPICQPIWYQETPTFACTRPLGKSLTNPKSGNGVTLMASRKP